MELEISTLNLLVDCEKLEKAWDLGLKSEHFSSKNARVYEFMLEYWFTSDRQKAATYDVVKYEFPAFKYADEEETLDWLIAKLKEKHKRNESANVLEDIATLISKNEVDDAVKLMGAKAHEITMSVSDRRSISDMSQNAAERHARYVEQANFDGKIKGAPIGLQEVDEHTYGFLPGELWTAGGYSGTGKTWLLAKAAIAAANAGWVPYLQTLELPRRDIEERIDALNSGVPYGALSRGKLDRDQIDALKASRESLKNKLIIDEPPRDERTVLMLVNRAIQHGANFLLIDQLSFIEGKKDRYGSVTEKTTEVMNDLKLAIQGISFFVAVQFNRKAKETSTIDTDNFADAATVERVSDGAFGLLQTKENGLNNMMQMNLMKFRRGPKKNWMLNWNLKNKTLISVDGEDDEL